MDDEIGKHRATKNRRTWCRGKKGVAHKPKCMPYQSTKLMHANHPQMLDGWKVLVCTECGKELAAYYPPLPGWKGAWPKVPHWADDT